MDLDPPSTGLRKVRFVPKPPPRRTPKPAKIETAVEDDGDDEAAQEIFSRKFNEHLNRRKPKPEQKSPVQVAFSHGVASTDIRAFGKQKEKIFDDRNDADNSKETLDDMQELVIPISTLGTGVGENKSASLTNNALFVKKKREYKEPWDYHHSYYPTTLPFRRPYSGDPELLDKAEFEDALEYDENSISSASDLGLLDQDDETPRMLSFQFPSILPSDGSRPSRVSKGKEIAGSSVNRESRHSTKKGCNLEEFPEGYMGKMLVYKSGAVKLKLGDVLYDVSPGSDCSFAQNVMAINTANNQCCGLGELNKMAIVTPDIDSLVSNMVDLE